MLSESKPSFWTQANPDLGGSAAGTAHRPSGRIPGLVRAVTPIFLATRSRTSTQNHRGSLRGLGQARQPPARPPTWPPARPSAPRATALPHGTHQQPQRQASGTGVPGRLLPRPPSRRPLSQVLRWTTQSDSRTVPPDVPATSAEPAAFLPPRAPHKPFSTRRHMHTYCPHEAFTKVLECFVPKNPD